MDQLRDFLNDAQNYELLMLAGVFAAVVLVTLAGYFVLARRRRLLDDKLRQQLDADDPGLSAPGDMVLGDLTPALAAQIPMGEGDRSELQQELRQAGYYRPTALLEYAALRTVFVIAPLIAAGTLALLVETPESSVYIWAGGITAAILGFSLPRIYVYYRGKARQFEIERGLPTAIDMLNLCLSGGLNVITSLERVVKELHNAYPVLAYELEIVRRQADLKTLDFALNQFANRTGLPNVRNLAVILGQSENLGADASNTLREYADSMRTAMKQRADEMANKAPFKLLFPAYLMAMGAAVLIISPTILEFTAFRQQNILGHTREQGRGALKTPTVPHGPAVTAANAPSVPAN
jgi:tight adherence protein C